MTRLKPYYIRGRVEAGCDEAGRGCLAGPVVAAAVILPNRWNHPLLNDSKKMSEARRDILRTRIENDFQFWAVGMVFPEEIDRINILQASFLAMHKALDQLGAEPDCILVDGNRFNPYGKLLHECVVKGDGIYRSIAAASVLAKTHRDAYMADLHGKYPEYDWQQNKGYPTKQHRAAIEKFGPTEYHRMSFTLLPEPMAGIAENSSM